MKYRHYRFSADEIVSALRQSGGKPEVAALQLGVAHMAVRRAMVKHGISIVVERRVVAPTARRSIKAGVETRKQQVN